MILVVGSIVDIQHLEKLGIFKIISFSLQSYPNAKTVFEF